MFEKYYCWYQNILDPPQSTPLATTGGTPATQWLPFKRGTFIYVVSLGLLTPEVFAL